MKWHHWVLIGLVIGLGLGLLLFGWWLIDPARQLTNQFDGPASFSIRYPAEWISIIPEMGIMVLAEPETLGGQPGPSVTIKRDTNLMLEGNLTETLEAYLARGPEARGEWMRVTEITPLTLVDDREAVSIDLQGRELAQDPEMRVRLVVTKADNLAVYVVGLSAPQASWAENESLLRAMLNSLHFTE